MINTEDSASVSENLFIFAENQDLAQRKALYRWVPVDPNTDYPKSWIYSFKSCGNHTQTTCVLFCTLKSKCAQSKDFHLFFFGCSN